MIDAALVASDNNPILMEAYESRNGNWYIAMEEFTKLKMIV